MTKLSTTELASQMHDQLVWETGVRAGRDSLRTCMTHEEILAESPYLIDGQNPVDLMLERIAELEKEQRCTPARS